MEYRGKDPSRRFRAQPRANAEDNGPRDLHPQGVKDDPPDEMPQVELFDLVQSFLKGNPVLNAGMHAQQQPEKG